MILGPKLQFVTVLQWAEAHNISTNCKSVFFGRSNNGIGT